MSATTRFVPPADIAGWADPGSRADLGSLADLDSLADLVQRWAHGLGAPEDPGFQHRFATGWAAASRVAWLRLDDAQPVGFVSADIGAALPWPGASQGRWLHLTGFYVLPEHRRHGHGRALLEAAAAWATAQGCTRITVTADDAARPVYADAGFVGQPRSMTLRLQPRGGR